MNLVKTFIMGVLLIFNTAFARNGGDDVGNGGFAYKQSVIILKMATSSLEDKIKYSTMPELIKNTQWKEILSNTLKYSALDKYSKKNAYRGGRRLQMDYKVKPAAVIILEPFFLAFAGRTDGELEVAAYHVEKLLLHEAAHIWGYDEQEAEDFAKSFLNNSDKRPTDDISIKYFCACKEGKSDLNNSCNSFCAHKPISASSVLYATTEIGIQTLRHNKLGNLYNWCHVQLINEPNLPQCELVASSKGQRIFLPVTISPGENSFTASIDTLPRNQIWNLHLEESKSGSYAKTKSFQIIRPRLTVPHEEDKTKLMVNPINQFTCINFSLDSEGNRDSLAKTYFYFQSDEDPSPLPPANGKFASRICHDDQLNPGDDSSLYPRLEYISSHLAGWSESDPRLMYQGEADNKPLINAILTSRLEHEYGMSGSGINLFHRVKYADSRLNSQFVSLGFMMPPFVKTNGNSYCPLLSSEPSDQPLFKILGDYLGDTEGLYMAEKEPEVIDRGMKTIYGTMLVNETQLYRHGFHVLNGVKVRVAKDSMHSKTTYYYWPFSDAVNPLEKEQRKLFTVKSFNELNGSSGISLSFNSFASDKKLGCIPKVSN